MSKVPKMVPIEHWCPDREGQPIVILLDGEPVWMAFAAYAGDPGTVYYHVCDEDGEPRLNELGNDTITGKASGRVEVFHYPRKTLKDCECGSGKERHA